MRKVVSEVDFPKKYQRESSRSPNKLGPETPITHLVNQAYFEDILNPDE